MLGVNLMPTAPEAVTLVVLAAQRHRIGSATDARLGIRPGIG
jgi:hypothetical protein